jgi:predicted regulator of Ras-like GTPase activity (Roadblock/LC7/MglB family)
MAGESWALFEREFWALNDVLYTLIARSFSRTAMLIDRDGRLIASVGEAPSFDPQSFAALSAADLAASKELASMMGEADFRSQAHQGAGSGIYQRTVDDRVILVVLYDHRTTLGLVRLRSEKAGEALGDIFARIFGKMDYSQEQLEGLAIGADFGIQAESQIDKLFG